MSQFIDNIKEQLTGRKRLDPQKTPLKAELRQRKALTMPLIEKEEVRVGVEWGRTFFCNRRAVPAMVDNVIRELREAIYGDLRHRVIRLERAVYEQNHAEIKAEIRDIIRETMGQE